MDDKNNPYGYSGNYDQYRSSSDEGHKAEKEEDAITNNPVPPIQTPNDSEPNWEKAENPPVDSEQVPPIPQPADSNTSLQDPAASAAYPVAPSLNNPYAQQYAGQYPPQAGQGYPQTQYPYVAPVTVDERAQKLAYWGIGLFGGNIFFGLFLIAFILPVFLVPLVAIAGTIVSYMSNKIQKNQLATVSFWLNLVCAVLSIGLILLALAFFALLAASLS